VKVGIVKGLIVADDGSVPISSLQEGALFRIRNVPDALIWRVTHKGKHTVNCVVEGVENAFIGLDPDGRGHPVLDRSDILQVKVDE
jgi:hypothetical protein